MNGKNSRRILKIVSIGVLLFCSIVCKKQSIPNGLIDEKWREESSELVSSYCQKLAECAENQKADLKESTNELVRERLNPAYCADKFRKSNAYLLANEDPEKIKQIVRGCFKSVIMESCEKIRTGVIVMSADCAVLQNIQSKR
ncbi:hypothetical protein EHQ12_08475 [Leptospira gomenensis]|uniref:Uncharacterized protein n=1 Tax=Leptospira gomenensis TaxID=2484974 RepID=A0A5F1Z206_9LEPT|nr:hypothetical protein [Leptospira gomenensis]TGK35910.1 hypothetical protein EHQ17_04815 [Leptospira gomenensis]TGK40058.1 hypothetical protein EHQ12_08475 [Leptospira gomenensis]TGK51508.1 hypothetical protein EHQ07_02870 [Leptospira gomenensis]TGK68065.1 hypothetical protein EHQ13_01400 [Leptospira gomenensis]